MGELPTHALVDHWNVDQVHVSGGRWAGRFTREASLAALAASARTDAPAVVRALMSSPGGLRSVGVPLQALQSVLDASGTLLVEDAARWLPELATLGRTAARELGHAGQVRADLLVAAPGGPIGAVGEPSLILQSEGRCRLPEGTVLVPGDLLHLPAGQEAGHAVLPSVLVRLVFAPLDFAQLLERLVWRELAASPEWRSVPPLRGEASEVRFALEQRIDELQALLGRWRAQPHELLRMLAAERWREPLAQAEGGGLRVAPAVVVLKNTPGACIVVVGEDEIELAGPLAAVLRAALVAGPFQALEVPGLSPAAVESALAMLAQAGILVGCG